MWASSPKPGHARTNARFFGIDAELRAGAFPAALPVLRRGDLLVFGWAWNELEDRAREEGLRIFKEARANGVGALLIEPAAESIWADWQRVEDGVGQPSEDVPLVLQRPALITLLDRLAHLDHRQAALRVLARLSGHRRNLITNGADRA